MRKYLWRLGMFFSFFILSACSASTTGSHTHSENTQPEYIQSSEVILDENGRRTFPAVSYEQEADYQWQAVEAKFRELGLAIPQRPDISVIKLFEPGDPEIAEATIRCLKEEGWLQSEKDGDAIATQLNSAEDEAFYSLSNYKCFFKYYEKRYPERNEDDIAKEWHSIQNKVIPCLAEKGYVVSNFPSEKTYVDYYFAKRSTISIFDYIDAPESEYERVLECERLSGE